MNYFDMKTKAKFSIAFMMSLLMGLTVFAQPSSDDPETLVEEILIGGSCLVVENVTYSGGDSTLTYFQQSDDLDVGFEEGLVMTTGPVSVIYGPNDEGAAGDIGSGNSDPDLAQLIGLDESLINDAVVLEFDFQPSTESISFEYIFASEEYPEYVCSDFNDVFGFFISGPGISGPFTDDAENIALIPGTDLPVAINSVNPGVEGAFGLPGGCISLDYEDLYNDNTGGEGTQYDGYTNVLTALAEGLTPCETYHIKLAIADAFDSSFDSGVFLRANSFSQDVPFIVEAITNSLNGEVTEGCESGTFEFVRDSSTIDEPLVVEFTLSGDAVSGEDFEDIGTSITIEPGELNAVIDIPPFADGIAEGPESVIITVDNVECDCTNTSISASFLIIDDDLEIEAGPDVTICAGEGAQLDALVPSGATISWEPADDLDDPTSIAPIATPANTTTYYLAVADSSGCSALDSLVVNVIPALEIDLAPIAICVTEPTELLLDGLSGNEGVEFVWEPADGLDDPTIAQPTATITESINYTITITDDSGCTAIAEQSIDTTELLVDIEYDEEAILCTGDELVLTAVTGAGAEFSWQDESTETNLTITESGVYSVTALLNGCEASTEVEITFGDSPMVDLGENPVICDGETITLDATTDGATYEWQDGADTTTYEVSEPGDYSVTITVGDCTGTDEVTVTVGENPVIDLGDDGLLCPGEEAVLDATTDGAVSYEWQDGTDTPTYTITETGSYTVTVVLDNGCTGEGTVSYEAEALPPPNVQDILLLCESDTTGYLLQPDVPFGEEGNYTYLWHTGSTADSLIITVEDEGTVLWLETTGVNCSRRDTIELYLYECEIFLPITWLSFDGQAIEAGNQLTWETATESNSYGFILERSYDGMHFEEIAMIESHHDSQELNSYSYIDTKYTEANAYYRLRHQDNDGQEQLSSVVLISRAIASDLQITPIPANDFININFNSDLSANYQVNFIDVTGRTLFTESWTMESGANSRQIDLNDLSAGVYFLQLTQGSQQWVEKLVIK